MAHYAHVKNGIVDKIIVAEQELIDQMDNPSEWVQTSYNTYGNVHKLGNTPLRANYAGIGFTYDADRDVFIPPKPEGEGWILDEDTFIWINPEIEVEE